MTFPHYNKDFKLFARQLRSQQTEPELLVWSHIRKKQMLGIQFYRQKAIENYIVDFYAPAVKLVLEIDGQQHYEAPGIEQDLVRDTFLQELGLTILRFDNCQVRTCLHTVLESVYDYIEDYFR